ncbi:MAG: hypothetical protein M3Z04_10155 [Chloroflexota bacterium]|nr:hypothetical protein [Chloroflexota bacterium]
MPDLCQQRIASRSKYDALQPRYCQREKSHPGQHEEFPYLRDLAQTYPAVANKIVRDATMTTGAAWKSAEAGPNRILRWIMLQPAAVLLTYGLDMANLQPQVVAKLREKAALYDDCMSVAKKLTWLAYQMPGAPLATEVTKGYLEAHFGLMTVDSTWCLVCRAPLPFSLFAQARRGKAEVETGHSNPRSHTAGNVGFAHRECNIAQGSKTLREFYDWIAQILARVQHP